MLGSWINHHDARSQNTLNTWIPTSEGKGYLDHYVIDWGDTLGGLQVIDEWSRRVGYTYYIDFGQMGLDFITFGIPERPWDRAKFGPAGEIFGYFNDTDFVPEDWHVGYPNVAFSAMQEQDAAWMARIIARIGEDAIDQIVDQARLTDPLAVSELKRILKGRRLKILQRYLTRLSSLTDPEFSRPEHALRARPGGGGRARGGTVALGRHLVFADDRRRPRARPRGAGHDLRRPSRPADRLPRRRLPHRAPRSGPPSPPPRR